MWSRGWCHVKALRTCEGRTLAPTASTDRETHNNNEQHCYFRPSRRCRPIPPKDVLRAEDVLPAVCAWPLRPHGNRAEVFVLCIHDVNLLVCGAEAVTAEGRIRGTYSDFAACVLRAALTCHKCFINDFKKHPRPQCTRARLLRPSAEIRPSRRTFSAATRSVRPLRTLKLRV